MTFLAPEFRHDVFVSYSHGDVDGAGTSLLKTWSLALARNLQAELRIAPELASCTVFIDESQRPEQGLDRSDPLTQQLRAAASGAASLLIFMSPHYLRSDWCRHERSWWFEQTEAEAFPEVSSRFFVALFRGPRNFATRPGRRRSGSFSMGVRETNSPLGRSVGRASLGGALSSKKLSSN